MILLLVLVSVIGSRSKVLGISQQDAREAIEAAEVSSQEAFLKIQAANREGGNVTSLAGRFNEALQMLDKAKIFMDEELYDRAVTTAEEAQQLFKAIEHDASILQAKAAAEESNKRMIILLASPILAILITLLSYFLIRVWQRRRVERIMEMEVSEA